MSLCSRPRSSALRMMVRASRSLMLPLGFRNSHLPQTVRCSASKYNGISGVFPIRRKRASPRFMDWLLLVGGRVKGRRKIFPMVVAMSIKRPCWSTLAWHSFKMVSYNDSVVSIRENGLGSSVPEKSKKLKTVALLQSEKSIAPSNFCNEELLTQLANSPCANRIIPSGQSLEEYLLNVKSIAQVENREPTRRPAE